MNQKGISSIVIVLIIVGVLGLAGGVWYWQKTKAPGQKACTQEAKICPDGTAVGRTGPNCEFAPCPGAEDETANWKTYRNEKYGFEFKYSPRIKFISISDRKTQTQYAPDTSTVEVNFINFFVNTTSSKWGARDGRFLIFSIGIWPVSAIPEEELEVMAGMPYLTDNGKEVFMIHFGQDFPEDWNWFFPQYSAAIKNSFHLLSNDISNWKTYRNEQYGFEVKYPAKYFLLESPSHVEFSKDQSGAGMGYNPTSLGWAENPEQLSPEEWLERYKERFTSPSSSIFDLQKKETNLGRAVIFRLVPPSNRYALIEKPQSKIIIQISEGEKDSFEMILDSIKSF